MNYPVDMSKSGGTTMITNPTSVKQQYSTDKNLTARINLHAKHSTNKQGFFNWLWEHYNFSATSRILELGCGNGEQWKTKADTLPGGCSVILSDFSAGMVDSVKQAYAHHKSFLFQQIDIQDIPFPDDSFDIVIANYMLYHVPDLPRGLSEVKRVLKPGGVFYSCTLGSGNMQPFLHEAFKLFDPDTTAFTQRFSFTLQNGHEILSEFFQNVKRIDYEDSLSITETGDLMNWIKSSITLDNGLEQKLHDHFEHIRKQDGAINIPKESGLFVSQKYSHIS